MQEIKIENIFIGSVVEHWPGKPASAIHKEAVSGEVEITKLGISEDRQADLNVHGGIDKAIHHYASDHYQKWIDEEYLESGTIPAAFGENISTFGLTEIEACIGDIFKMGSATVQISQGRQPCWKLNKYRNNPKFAKMFQQTGRTGWYYRVLEEGTLKIGDQMSLIERPNPAWSVKLVTQARLGRKIDKKDAKILSQLPELALGWRDAFEKMAQGDLKEDVSSRLGS